MTEKTTKDTKRVEAMFEAGVHYGFSKSRRHPIIKKFVFGTKQNTDIVDLEKTDAALTEAKQVIASVVAAGKQVLFVGTKPEVRTIVEQAAQKAGMPFVTKRWVGGVLTNFPEIHKRVENLETLMEKKEKGTLDASTKKERLMIDREITRMNEIFSGIISMKKLPGAIFVVDSREERIAVTEAIKVGIPVVSLSGSDCDVSGIAYPIVGNDVTSSSVNFFLDEIVNAVTGDTK